MALAHDNAAAKRDFAAAQIHGDHDHDAAGHLGEDLLRRLAVGGGGHRPGNARKNCNEGDAEERAKSPFPRSTAAQQGRHRCQHRHARLDHSRCPRRWFLEAKAFWAWQHNNTLKLGSLRGTGWFRRTAFMRCSSAFPGGPGRLVPRARIRPFEPPPHRIYLSRDRRDSRSTRGCSST